MSGGHHGFILRIDEPERAEMLADQIENSGRFSDAVSAPDWKLGDNEICLVCLSDREVSGKRARLDYAALAVKGKWVATKKYKVTFSDFVSLDELPLHEIEKRVGARLRRELVRSTSGGGGRVPPKTWEAVIREIYRLRPSASRALTELFALRNQVDTYISAKGSEILAQEKDAVLLARSIFGIKNHRSPLRWSGRAGKELAPFLRGLSEVNIDENTMIAHDSRVFGDWGISSEEQIGAVVFTRGKRRLTVMNVNNKPLEHTLGVDLLYYIHDYRSFVLVQYKRLKKETEHFVYRPIDKSYRRQIEHMRHFRDRLRELPAEHFVDAYRLHSTPFYFKICKTPRFKPGDQSMIKGMYFPFDLWEAMMEDDSISGPNGGKVVSYETVNRYLNNTEFINLCQDGWIGSKGRGTLLLNEIARGCLTGDHSVVIAEETRL